MESTDKIWRHGDLCFKMKYDTKSGLCFGGLYHVNEEFETFFVDDSYVFNEGDSFILIRCTYNGRVEIITKNGLSLTCKEQILEYCSHKRCRGCVNIKPIVVYR